MCPSRQAVSLSLESLDEGAQSVLLGALALLAVVGAVAGAQSAAGSLQYQLRASVSQSSEAAKKLLVYAAFLGGVILAAKAVLEV